MGGAKIGRVAGTPILTEEANVQIDLLIHDRVRIPDGSTLGISSASLLGDKMIMVIPPKVQNGKFLVEDTTILGAGPTGLDAIQSNAEILSRDARKLMDGATETLKHVDEAVIDIRSSAQELTKAIQKVNQSILSTQNVEHVGQIIDNFNQTRAQFRKVSEELEPTMVDARKAIQAMEKAASGAQSTFGKIDQRVDELAPTLAELPKATKAITQAATKANQTMDEVVKGNGLLGALTQDDEVSTDAKAFIRNLRERGILRYRDGESIHPADDPRNRFQGKRR
jgi:ABC-type transporter Mla subunit MlaD